MSTPDPSRDPRNMAGGGDRYETLLEVLEQQARQAAADQERERRMLRRRERRLPVWVVVVLALVAAWLWAVPPSILRVGEPAAPPLEEEQAALRFAMYVQAQRIEAFQARQNRLPETLAESGPPLPGMDYVRLADGLFQLTGTANRVTLTYRSDLPLDEFVGNGADVLDESTLP